MNELQKKELEILRETVSVIEKLGLTYYLVCGTSLGAAKYKGFIPWDDDVDIGLPRKDYNIFCEKAQKYLPSHLFLQNHKTDKYYPLIFSKVRNSNTTYIEKNAAHLDIHHGVYIDVFPLDGYPTDESEQEKLEKKKYKFNLSMLCCFGIQRTKKTELLAKTQRFLGMHKTANKRISKIEKEFSKWDISTSDYLCNHGNWQGKLEYAPKEQYGEGTWATFEGLRVRIPEKYDEYLTQKYGDWRADLPKDQQVGHHYYEICDLSRPYTDYIEHLPNGRIRIIKPEA